MDSRVDNIFILTLLQIPRVGRKSAIKLLQEYSQPVSNEREFQSLLEFYRGKHSKSLDSWDTSAALDTSRDVIARSSSLGISITSYWDSTFPKSLLATEDPPIILHHRGCLDVLTERDTVALVGTRKPTANNFDAGIRLGKQFAEAGVCVVSGLAMGCDTAGHHGCLEANGIAVGVLANGLDTVNPKSSVPLGERIIDSGGVLLSEYPIGTQAHPGFFAERDRIQAGLSKAVVVIETGLKGGTMQTIKHAKKNHRLIACVASPVDSPSATSTPEGNQYLISNESAVPLTSEEDVASLIADIRRFDFEPENEPASQGEFNL